MGLCFSNSSSKDFQDQRAQARAIEQQLKEIKREDNHFTLLLLGTGDSGKSTFCKQMRLLHEDGFTEREFFTHRNVLQENALFSMQKLLNACKEQKVDIEKFEGIVLEVLSAKDLTPPIAEHISKLWKNTGIKELLENSRRLHLPSATEYYFENALRFAAENFIPNEDDLIRARAQTTGITETKFEHKSTHFSIVDVGGQRSERRKWLHCFDNVTCVIYLAALDEYDMILQEDDKTNRLEESLTLFHEVSGSNWFKETPFVLFLNKSDLFEKKIKKYPLSGIFPEFNGETNYEQCVQYIRKKYETKFSGFRLYVFVTCAVDRNNCLRMFEAVQDTILSSEVRKQQYGL